MTLAEQKSVLIQYLKMKVEQSDWKGVGKVAKELKRLEKQFKEPQMELPLSNLGPSPSPQIRSVPATNASEVPPSEVVIPHHMGKVASLLKMGDEELLDNLFPLPKGVEA